VPAFNEAEGIGDTIRSLQAQSAPFDQIIVVDDCSSDGTGEIAGRLGATVLRPERNTGSKAGAQNFALASVRSELTMTIDADTTLAADAVEKILLALLDKAVAAACGFVVPRRVHTLWERGRYIEYLFAMTFHKQIQDFYRKPLISSGCFSVYRTGVLRDVGAWQTRTLTEDVDLTWTLYQAGWRVRFVADAVSYPREPHNYHFMATQLRRWADGFVQNVQLHWKGLRGVPLLRVLIALWFVEAAASSVVYLLLVPMMMLFLGPRYGFIYVIDAPVVIVPVMVGAIRRREVRRALLSLPALFVTRMVSSIFALRALWLELVIGRSLRVYEKGH